MSESEIKSENEIQSERKSSLGMTSLPPGTFEHDAAVSGKYQKFSAQMLRLSLAAIGFIGLLVAGNIFSREGNFGWFVKNTSFSFWLFVSLLCFGISAGFALLHLYFSADSEAYHLEYLRLENKLGDVSQIDAIEKRKDFDSCRDLYIHGKEYKKTDPEKLIKQAADERDVRNFLWKISRKLLFLSGLLLWIGTITLIFSFVPVVFR